MSVVDVHRQALHRVDDELRSPADEKDDDDDDKHLDHLPIDKTKLTVNTQTHIFDLSTSCVPVDREESL